VIQDLRDFMAKCEERDELRRIKAEVDWNLELTHITKLNEANSGPALLFENVKGYKIPVLSSALGTARRLAIILGMPEDYTLCQQAKEWVELTQKSKIPPKIVSDGPVMENVIEGDKVDLLSFPAPKFFPLDGGRYIGTAHCGIRITQTRFSLRVSTVTSCSQGIESLAPRCRQPWPSARTRCCSYSPAPQRRGGLASMI
jgi:UbiD family decarboxylase